MAGLIVFRSLEEAKEKGYHVYDRTPTGYLVRIKTDAGFALALVEQQRIKSQPVEAERRMRTTTTRPALPTPGMTFPKL